MQALVVAAQQLGVVLQQRCGEGDVLEAALAVLEEIPLDGKVVSVDAGLLQRCLVEHGVTKRGGYIDWVKGNHRAVCETAYEWELAHTTRAPTERSREDS